MGTKTHDPAEVMVTFSGVPIMGFVSFTPSTKCFTKMIWQSIKQKLMGRFRYKKGV